MLASWLLPACNRRPSRRSKQHKGFRPEKNKVKTTVATTAVASPASGSPASLPVAWSAMHLTDFYFSVTDSAPRENIVHDKLAKDGAIHILLLILLLPLHLFSNCSKSFLH